MTAPVWLSRDLASFLAALERARDGRPLACAEHLVHLREGVASLAWLEKFDAVVRELFEPVAMSSFSSPFAGERLHATLLVAIEAATRGATDAEVFGQMALGELGFDDALRQLGVDLATSRPDPWLADAGHDDPVEALARMASSLDDLPDLQIPKRLDDDLAAACRNARERVVAELAARLDPTMRTESRLTATLLDVPLPARVSAVPTAGGDGYVEMRLATAARPESLLAFYDHWALRDRWPIAERVVHADGWRMAVARGTLRVHLAASAAGELLVRVLSPNPLRLS